MILPNTGTPTLKTPDERIAALETLRDRAIKMGAELPWEDRGAILALLGSAERAFYLIERIHDERKSVPRIVPAAETARDVPGNFGQAAAVPAE